jgi:hypothetical protein
VKSSDASRPGAATAPDHRDSQLRGRRYGIPFEIVWKAVVRLADGGLSRWELVEADDQEGLIRARCRTRLLRLVDHVEVRVGLDPEAQTTVHLVSRSGMGKADLGRNRRRIRRFLRALDRALAGEGWSPLPPGAPPKSGT